ncbi:E3 ubiquitin-protein ligase RNF8-like isoform X1 [Neodiprion fabricii]|uniref:E3 ubiquitin-protein ligase RNF8-like isoform X1 n=1 Tax=Neodiprion fabricii TaxID=2872261 RepID=UPI001ED91E03|nr:E3 ubiquitin-protein ligase RNF8-like isoform X1 [Neodiprion fabricii]
MEEQESHSSKRNMSDSLEAVLVNVENTDPSSFIHIDKNEFKIGRGRSNDEILANISISRQHCIIKRSDVGEWTIQDFSTTGTFVNGNQLAPGEIRTIKINDSVRFGPMSEFLYKVQLLSKSEPLAKKAKMSVPEMDLRDIVMKQKTFEESQQMERDNLAEQMKAKHNEQLELKNELQKLLNEREAAKGVKDHLNNQINMLEKNIEEVKQAEMNLEKLNRELSERLDKERQEFETKLNEEKKKLEEALEISRKEKEMLVNNMKEQLEKLKNEQQIECKKLTESLSEEKKTAEKLQSEKVEIEQKLKETEDALLKIESKANELQTTLEKQNAESAAKVVALGTVAENVEIIDESHLTILDTIDLTKETPTKKAAPPSSTVSANEDVFNKVGDIMDEQLTCSICSELFVKATTLNCTHTFCQYCIDTWEKKKKECPVCRTGIIAMNRSLVLDNFIDKMVENLSVEYKKRRTDIVEERREYEKAAKQPANQARGKKGRGRGRGGNANTNTNRTGNTSTAATSRTAGNNHIPGRTSGSNPDWNNASGSSGQHRQQRSSSGGTTNHEQTPASTQGSGNTTQQTNDDDDGSTWSTSTDGDGEDTNSLSSVYSYSQTSEDPESHFGNMDISIDSDGHSSDDSWSGIVDGYEDYWSEPQDDYIEGRIGALYGGYGSCYSCGNRGHWAPGCPFT